MSVFSYHIVHTSHVNALKTLFFPLRAASVTGLVHAEFMNAMTLGAAVLSPSRFLVRKLVLFAQWENERCIEEFLQKSQLGKVFNNGWHVRLAFLRQWGSVSEFDLSREAFTDHDAGKPVVAVTLARMRLPEVPRFIRWGRPVEKLVRDHPEAIMSMASIRFPRTVSTFSIWKSEKAMKDMVHGHSNVQSPKRHIDAMKERDRKDFHFEFTTLRFKPLSEYGIWNGKRYLDDSM